MAAAAKASSGLADARIPCPLCGGLIHPIAGRCKHCKEDVSANRSARPASAPLPSLHASPRNGHANGNGHAAKLAVHPANAYMAVPIAVRTEPDSQPILPPRQTGRMQATGTARPETWKSWPIIVIGLAALAIIVAVILMVWPPGASSKADAKTLAPPPAPERMDTNPSPSTGGGGNGPQGSLDDPWKSNPGAAPDPAPAQPPARPTVPDIDDIQPPNLSDPFRSGGGGLGMNDNMLGMTTAILQHACDRLASCPNADDTMKQLCSVGKLSLPNAPAPTCSAAQKCLSEVDALPCGDLDAATTMSMMQGVQACVDALRC